VYNTHINNEIGRVMDSRTVIRMVEEAGWKLVRIEGSHHHFKKAGERHLVTVPHPKKDLPIGTLNNILKTAGLK
jgi:predicted RNA binding protein YcfA (HicA-like mRNA interferase family)